MFQTGRSILYVCKNALESDAENFCEKAKEEDLLLVAATDFGCPGYVRISYCVDEDMIKRSFKAFKALKKNTRNNNSISLILFQRIKI